MNITNPDRLRRALPDDPVAIHRHSEGDYNDGTMPRDRVTPLYCITSDEWKKECARYIGPLVSEWKCQSLQDLCHRTVRAHLRERNAA